METLRKNVCFLQGVVYSNGSEIRGKTYHLACKNGEWQDLDDEASAKPSLAFFYH